MSENCNGYTNYETWCVHLWLTNERPSYEHWREVARQTMIDADALPPVKAGEWTHRFGASNLLSEHLQKCLHDTEILKSPSLYTDLLLAALGEVDWFEVAEALLDDICPDSPSPLTDVAEADRDDQAPSDSAAVEAEAGSLSPTVEADGSLWNVEDYIHVYTRAQAIADGVLIDAGQLAVEAGFRYPVALTSAAWHATVAVSSTDHVHDEVGRLWDVLNVLLVAIRSADGKTSRIDFCVNVADENENLTTVKLKSLCGPGDDAKPVITVMFPDED